LVKLEALEMPRTKQRETNRCEALLDAAALRFAERGYHRTTMRDISQACGMRSGSSYYHFASKAELLLAVYEEGVRRVTTAVRDGLAANAGPWERLESALARHIEAVLAPTAYARVIVTVLPDDVPEIADELRTARDAYEQLWRELVGAIDADVDHGLLRLFLLGAANATRIWYRPDAQSPSEIAAVFVGFLRRPLEER
jgi:AcrR family transcriptional regulator